MVDDCWQVTADRGFLIAPDPLTDLGLIDTGLDEEIVETLETIAEDLPDLIIGGFVHEKTLIFNCLKIYSSSII